MKKLVAILTVLLGISLTGCQSMNKESIKEGWGKFTEKVKFWDRDSDQYTITVTNITNGSYLTPLLVAGHADYQTRIFIYGKAASPELQAVAEVGDIEPLAAQFEAADAEVIENPAGDLLGPGESTTFNLSMENTRISLVSQILPTNDGFIALDNANLREGSQLLYAIDAGTEANDEQITGGAAPNTPGIPADPGGKANASAPGILGRSAEGSVERHPGISGGEGSALDPEVHGWSGAIASITISM